MSTGEKSGPVGDNGHQIASLKHKAAAFLREQIITGRLLPGARIDIEEVGGVLGMSRLPVREALIELSQEALIDVVPRRGTFVARLKRVDVLDNYRIYGRISGIIASRAAGGLTSNDLRQLRDYHDAFAGAQHARDQNHVNVLFHDTINVRGGSRRLMSLLDLLGRSLLNRYFELVPNWAEAAVEDHSEILSALEARDPDRARDAVEQHHERSGRRALAVLDGLGYWTNGEHGAN